MTFWDSSALTPLLASEAYSPLRESQFRSDPRIFVWYATRAEIESAFARRKREGLLDLQSEAEARRKLAILEMGWVEVAPTRKVRDRSLRLLRTHSLRSADAFQLAAALVACGERPAGCEFRTGDVRLRIAAEAEGFAAN